MIWTFNSFSQAFTYELVIYFLPCMSIMSLKCSFISGQATFQKLQHVYVFWCRLKLMWLVEAVMGDAPTNQLGDARLPGPLSPLFYGRLCCK